MANSKLSLTDRGLVNCTNVKPLGKLRIETSVAPRGIGRSLGIVLGQAKPGPDCAAHDAEIGTFGGRAGPPHPADNTRTVKATAMRRCLTQHYAIGWPNRPIVQGLPI
jgi:hypothetical protein